MSLSYDFLVVGGGIFGICTAIELAKRKHRVGLINPDTIPHHLSASTDISKAVRMEYGSDPEYASMAETSIRRWKEWNALFQDTLYHETGFLMLCRKPVRHPDQSFERTSMATLNNLGYQVETMDTAALQKMYPLINAALFPEAIFNPVGGFAESGRIVELLQSHAGALGVDIHLGQTAESLEIRRGSLASIRTKEGSHFSFGHAVISAGAHTPQLVPDLKPCIRATGHPVYWVRPEDPEPFLSTRFPVFTADIANTGWYGFPVVRTTGVIKFGLHSTGLPLHPDNDDRLVTDREVADFRRFLGDLFPVLARAPVVYTRRCLYTDTLDGHFWIDRHPEVRNLTVSTGGSGHGFKMGPVIGEMTADVAEGGMHRFSERYGWRQIEDGSFTGDAARRVE